MSCIQFVSMQQGTLEWHRLRLGRITSSVCAALMTKGKGKNDGELSETAKSELYRLKAERNLKKQYRDLNSGLQAFLDRTNVYSKSMEFGKETEAEARKEYEGETFETVHEVAFLVPEDDELGDFWGDSPDGIIKKDGRIVGCLEIKCPKPATFVEYVDRFANGETLKTIEKKYYWQVINHLAVSGAYWCDFIVYDPMQKNGFFCTRINRADVEADISALTEAVKNAIKYLR